jgi:hypothetical protein
MKWYMEMSNDEQASILGRWVWERTVVYNRLLKEAEKNIANRSVGNYYASF